MNLKTLLGVPEFHLRLLTNDADTERAISWIYSSDLSDPTPFLSEGQMLLTTGRQFAQGGLAEQYLDYVKALSAIGIVGLGFGTGLGAQCVPEALIEACEEYAIPLFEVPYATPFIALIRWLSDFQVERLRQRDSWVINAQRAVSLAALKGEGALVSLDVLASKLAASVILMDHELSVLYAVGPQPVSAEYSAVLTQAAAQLLSLDKPANRGVRLGAFNGTLHTLGRSGHFLGVLAVIHEPPTLGREARLVLLTALALAESFLAQRSSQTETADGLMSEAFRLLFGGQQDSAARIAGLLGVSIPSGQLMIGQFKAEPDRLQKFSAVQPAGGPALHVSRLLAILRSFFLRKGLQALAAEVDGNLTVIAEAAAVQMLEEFCRVHQLAGGFALVDDRRDMALAFRQSGLALSHAPNGAHLAYSPVFESDVSSLFDETRLHEQAELRLEKILARKDGAELLDNLMVWLSNNGSWDRAAQEIGIHRHSLRARVRKLGELLNLDFDLFNDRMFAWLLITNLPNISGA